MLLMMKVMIGDDGDDDDGDVIENGDEIMAMIIPMLKDDEQHS